MCDQYNKTVKPYCQVLAHWPVHDTQRFILYQKKDEPIVDETFVVGHGFAASEQDVQRGSTSIAMDLAKEHGMTLGSLAMPKQ